MVIFIKKVVNCRVYEGEVDTNCSCTKSCRSNVFSAFVQNRKVFRPPIQSEFYTQVYVYYTTKLITVSFQFSKMK